MSVSPDTTEVMLVAIPFVIGTLEMVTTTNHIHARKRASDRLVYVYYWRRELRTLHSQSLSSALAYVYSSCLLVQLFPCPDL